MSQPAHRFSTEPEPLHEAAAQTYDPNAPVSPEEALTLYGLFRERVRRSPEAVAYHQHDGAGTGGKPTWQDLTWSQVAARVARWQAALAREGLARGERVAVMARNGVDWVVFDQAALGLGLVVVPIYTNDRADNVAYCLADAGARLLLIDGEAQWKHLRGALDHVECLTRIVHLQPLKTPDAPRTVLAGDWLEGVPDGPLAAVEGEPDTLASIVYTSGTTGRPKGVMLSHRNMLWNARAALHLVSACPGDRFLSFLPLSHTLERTGGYYLPMMAGVSVAFARSVQQLGEDLRHVRPTLMISVPRVFELLYGRISDQVAKRGRLAGALFRLARWVGWRRFLHQQGRAGWSPALLLWPWLERRVARPLMARLGGRLRLIVSGGAPLSGEVAQLFIGLGVPLVQGYGLTEHSPVISVNPMEDNDPASVGTPLPGVEARIGEDAELLVRSPACMQGYWNDPEATARILDADGWLHTGDQVRLERGHLYITGRIKDILVLSNGEKVPPGDMEMAITLDPLVDQALVVGEGRHHLAALLVLNREHWQSLAAELHLDPQDPASLESSKAKKHVVKRIAAHTRAFPGYAQVRSVWLSLDPWTVENGLLTPTLKLRRTQILAREAEHVEALYAAR